MHPGYRQVHDVIVLAPPKEAADSAACIPYGLWLSVEVNMGCQSGGAFKREDFQSQHSPNGAQKAVRFYPEYGDIQCAYERVGLYLQSMDPSPTPLPKDPW